MEKRWVLKQKGDAAMVSGIAGALGIETALAELLVQRGVTNFEEARDFFRPDLAQLHDPFLLNDMDKAIEKIEQGSAWEETDEVVQVEVKKPLDKVIPVRLSSDKWEQLREEARELGIGPTTLARMWILECLHAKAKAQA